MFDKRLLISLCTVPKSRAEYEQYRYTHLSLRSKYDNTFTHSDILNYLYAWVIRQRIHERMYGYWVRSRKASRLFMAS